MNYYLIPEDEMKNEYLEESYKEIYDKQPSTDELVNFEKTIRKVDTVESQLIDGELMDVYVNYYVLKYKTKFPLANTKHERHTIEEVRAIIDEILESI